MWAIRITEGGKKDKGTKAPHKKLDPSAITFTIPFIASLFMARLPSKEASVNTQKANKNAFMIKYNPCQENIPFPTKITLNIQ